MSVTALPTNESRVAQVVRRALGNLHCIGSTDDELADGLIELGDLTNELIGDDPALREAVRAAAMERLRGFDGFERQLDVVLGLRAPGTYAADDLPDNVDPFTDMANAHRLAREHGRDLRYDNANGWTFWNGRVWRRDESEPHRRIMNVATRLLRYAVAQSERAESKADRELADKYLQHARKSQREPDLNHALKLALHMPPIATAPNVWDRDEWLMTCQNGTLDLQRGELKLHRREDLITRSSPIAYDEHALAPTWIAMLERILPDAQVRAFVQRFAGYSMSGSTCEQCFVVCVGDGANGKTTFLEALRHVLGDYALVTTTDTLMAAERGTRGSTNDVARLRGARLVTSVESGESRRLDEERIKALTGGDVVSARFLFKEFVEFTPQFKLWLAVNHKPTISGVDHGIWRRVQLVPFVVTIPKDEQDHGLAEKLRAEAPGILRWLVEGFLEWQRDGLQPPAAVTSATEEWRGEANVVRQFVDERCLLADYASAKSGALYAAFADWARAQGIEGMPQPAFGRRLGALGLQSHRGTHGARTWRGIGLLTEQEGDG